MNARAAMVRSSTLTFFALLFVLAASACGAYPLGDPVAIRTAPTENGWVRVEQRPWFTVDMPTAPQVTKPEGKVGFFADAQARELDATSGRQAFSIVFMHSGGGWNVDKPKLVEATIQDLGAKYDVRAVRPTPEKDGADLLLSTKDAAPLGVHVVLVCTSTMFVVMSVTTPAGKTAAESDSETRFFRSVHDL